jgi:hypothetical protein
LTGSSSASNTRRPDNTPSHFAGPTPWHQSSVGVVIGNRLARRTVNQKRLPLARPTFGAGAAAHQLRQLARDRQAETGAAVLARGGIVGLLEAGEQARHGVRRDADAGVLDLEAQQRVSAVSSANRQRSTMWPVR